MEFRVHSVGSDKESCISSQVGLCRSRVLGITHISRTVIKLESKMNFTFPSCLSNTPLVSRGSYLERAAPPKFFALLIKKQQQLIQSNQLLLIILALFFPIQSYLLLMSLKLIVTPLLHLLNLISLALCSGFLFL
jgi:hypothetical protein